MEVLTFGTRRSALARRQTELVVDELTRRIPSLSVRVVEFQTPGDRWQDRPIWSLGDKGVFVRPLEKALLEGRIDLAVHSLKDVPADQETPGVQFVAFPVREDPRDVLISRSGEPLESLPGGARLATSSLRRRMQLRKIRPDLELVDVRGNVDTRLRKLDEGLFDAIVLAAAGLVRLGLEDRISEHFQPDRLVPDAGQGILAVQARAEDQRTASVRSIDDAETRLCAEAERSVVHALGADCHSPVGAYARLSDVGITVRAVAATNGDSPVYTDQIEGPRDQASRLGRQLGERLRQVLEKHP